jgi:tripartite-type tricarboxylate transporter receptor subunit TctC
MRALAITSAKRNSALQEVVTVADSSLPGYYMINWFDAVMPKGARLAFI